MAESTNNRTTEWKIAFIRQHGNHSSPVRLRKMVMQSLGIPLPKNFAEHALLCGCYSLFSSHSHLLMAYSRILEHLGVDYTFMENEYCCGSPLVQTARGADKKRAKEASREFLQLNVEQAVQKKAKKIAYFCSSCARIAKSTISDNTAAHIYLLDLILDHLGDRRLQIQQTTAGYYEGCHSTIGTLFTGAALPWKRYREFLDRIEGLRVVDLPGDVCCRGKGEHILEKASERNLSAVICSCNNCVRFLEGKAGERIRVKHMVEVISDALERV